MLTLDQLWRLARDWYHDRLAPAFRGRSIEEAEAIFVAAGLGGSFWRMSGAT